MGKDVKMCIMINSCYESCILQQQSLLKAILIGILKKMDQMKKTENNISDAQAQR